MDATVDGNPTSPTSPTMVVAVQRRPAPIKSGIHAQLDWFTSRVAAALTVFGYDILPHTDVCAFIDEMHLAVPEDIERARLIIEARDNLMADAQRTAKEEADAVIDGANEAARQLLFEAQKEARWLVSRDGVTAAAREEAARIIAEANEIRAKALSAADEVMISVGRSLLTLNIAVSGAQEVLENGAHIVDKRYTAARAKLSE